MIREQTNTLNEPIQIDDRHSLECLSSNGCVSLQKTNVRMSGNHKLVYKSPSELFIESISSDDYLSRNMFKSYAVDKSQGYRYNLYMFLKQSTHNESIWKVKETEKSKAEQFSNQYQDLYKWGAYTETNDLIGKQFRFFAPLWTYGKLPDRFLIFRVKNNSYTSIREYLDKGVLVSSIDMKQTSEYGKYLHTLIDDIEPYCIQANFKESVIRYFGIDILSGKYKYNTESDLDAYLANERTVTEFNNSLTNGWMRGNLICPHLMNLEFAFDDRTAPEGFNNYVGLYCYDNEITNEEANILEKESGIIIINSTSKETQVYKSDTLGKYNPLPDYNEIIKTTSTTQLEKYELPPIAEIYLPFAPVPSSVLTISYRSRTEIEIYMIGDILEAKTTSEALELIAKQINNTVTQNIIVTASVVDQHLIIKSQLLNSDYEHIVINIPAVFQMVEPKYFIPVSPDLTHPELYNSMRGITLQDIFISNAEIPDDVDYVEIDNVDYQLEQLFKYQGSYVIRLDESFAGVLTIKSPVIKFKQTKHSEFYILSFIKHCTFDMTMADSPYYDMYDFDMSTYQMTFGKQLHESFERYSRHEQTKLDIELIEAYKSYFMIPITTEISNLYTLIDGHAVPVQQPQLLNLPPKEVLVRDFDTLTMFPSSTCKNEFDRLSESTLMEIKNSNLLEPLICKFGSIVGYDSYNNPVTLNIGLPWRNDNFLTTGYSARSLVNNTHMWFMLGSGPGPIQKSQQNKLTYTPYVNDIKKQTGYANIPLNNKDRYRSITLNIIDSKNDPTNTNFDVYDLMSYKVNTGSSDKDYYNADAWSWMYKAESNELKYNALFRGCEWSFTGNYEGYRFAVVMVTEPNVDKNKTYISPFNLVDNKVFKTLTLLINYYIPDKLITSCNGNIPYYLDRSFFYYSDKFYMPSAIDTLDDIESSENISMNLFESSIKQSESDTSGEHRYKNFDPAIITFDLNGYRDSQDAIKTKTINTWYTTSEKNEPIFYISLNQMVASSGNSHSFKELIHKAENTSDVTKFEWLYLTELSDTTISIMIRFTAYDIVQIEDSYIWCKDIFMEFVVNSVYLEEFNTSGQPRHVLLTLDDIIKNNAPTIELNGIVYTIPFWEKISSSVFMNLPITDSKGQRRGVRLTKEFYEEIDPRYSYPENIKKFFRTSTVGKQFLVFDTVSHYGDTDDIINFRNDIETKSGKLLEQDQYWFQAKGISKDNALFLNFGINSVTYDKLTADYVRKLLEMYPVKTFIATKEQLIETTKNIEMLLPSETYIIISLYFDYLLQKLDRLSSRTSFKISRLDGYYGPIFKRIVQPHSLTISNYILVIQTIVNVNIPMYKRSIGQLIYSIDNNQLYRFEGGVENEHIKEVSKLETTVTKLQTLEDISLITDRYIGQIFYIVLDKLIYTFVGGTTKQHLIPQSTVDVEYTDCVFPAKTTPWFDGRKICTPDESQKYCEEYLETCTSNIFNKYFYECQYSGISRSIIADAALAEHRGFISNTYYNNNELEIKYRFESDISLIEVTRDKLGPTILSKYMYYSGNLAMPDMVNAMKLYNPELNESNIIYEDFYKSFYKQFFIEWFINHYKVGSVKTQEGTKIDFYYTDFENIRLKTNSVYGKPITDIIIKFEKY